jgi:pectate lyase
VPLQRIVWFRAVVRAWTVALLIYLPASGLFSATWYVATNGSDLGMGTSNSPFATITHAQKAALSGDTVYLRGGTYFLSDANLTATNNPWAIVNNLTRSGISYVAYPGEHPVFDFSNVRPDGWRVTAFLVAANNCVFSGFDVVGVQITIQTNHTQSECFRVTGSNNRFERLAMHDGMGIGWYLTSGASNLVLNCDAWNNRGLDSGSLGNIDGFGCHPNSTSGTGNVLRGCRAWFNSDDGYDCINAWAPVTFDHCWSFYNGYFTNFASSGGDGNGIKAGGYGKNGSTMPSPVPRHVVEFSLTVRNHASGFYANHHGGGNDWLDNTAYRNGINYNMLCVSNDNLTDVPGFDHFMRNNLGYKGSTEVANLGPANDVAFNYFTSPVTVTSNDFQTLDESLLTLPRQPNGDLPYIAFAQLVSGSDLVDAGTNAGFAFAGAAPDLGAFEYGLNPPPSFVSATAGDGSDPHRRRRARRRNELPAELDQSCPSGPSMAARRNEPIRPHRQSRRHQSTQSEHTKLFLPARASLIAEEFYSFSLAKLV